MSDPDKEWLELSARLDPLRQRLKEKGYFLGLHLTSHPVRYEVYYGYAFLFTESDGNRVIERAERFVESRGKPEEKGGPIIK